MTLSAIGAHLWQSTLFAAAIGAATLALRRNHAAVRHALWMAASLKFLVPFAALAALGAEFGPRLAVPVTRTQVVIVMNNAGPHLPLLLAAGLPPAAPRDPAVPNALVATLWAIGAFAVLAVWAIRWRRVAAVERRSTPIESGRDLEVLRNLARAAGVKRPIGLVETTAPLEPGVFGVVRPVLLWPRTIRDRLSEPQIAAILAHEVAHVKRRDNLAAMLHMLVEALFWFHPLVWWIGTRLVDERERACDEAVVRAGGERRVYAQTILAACRAFVEAPMACVSGVTGSDLGKRIERIMGERPLDALSAWKKTLVAALPAAALVAPIVVGVLDGPRLRAAAARTHVQAAKAAEALQFEVASVKPNISTIAKVSIQTLPGGRFTAENVTLRQLIRFAYQLQDSQLSGGPKWLDEERFDIVAKADGDTLGDLFTAEQTRQPSRWQVMLRALLAERFKLQVHNEPRELPVYTLVAARRDGTLGPQLHPSTVDCSGPDGVKAEAQSRGAGPRCGIRALPGNLTGGGAAISQLANSLSAMVGRLVFDRTGLTGTYDFSLTWTPDLIPQGYDKKAGAIGLPPVDPNGPSIFTAVQEQLGLKLDAQKGPVDVLIVDRAERPVGN